MYEPAEIDKAKFEGEIDCSGHEPNNNKRNVYFPDDFALIIAHERVVEANGCKGIKEHQGFSFGHERFENLANGGRDGGFTLFGPGRWREKKKR